eukprot:162602_1
MDVKLCLHAIPCADKFITLFPFMTMGEICDLIEKCYVQGTTIKPGIGIDRDYGSSTETFSVALKYIHHKKINNAYPDCTECNAQSYDITFKYKNEYLTLAKKIDKRIKKEYTPINVQRQEIANIITQCSPFIDINIALIISTYSVEIKTWSYRNDITVDHYYCDNIYSYFKTSYIYNLRKNEVVEDKYFTYLEELFDGGQIFKMHNPCGRCETDMVVYSAESIKLFAYRMIRRFITPTNDENENKIVKKIVFGNKDMEILDEICLWNVVKALHPNKMNSDFAWSLWKIVWRKVFLLNVEKVPNLNNQNHSMGIFLFAMNAAAMNRGIIAYYTQL